MYSEKYKNENVLNKAIRKNMKAYRIAKGYTQENIAEAINVSTNHYSRIERGENNCSFYTLLCICDSLGITINQLILTQDEDYIQNIEKLLNINKDNIIEICKLLLNYYSDN